MATKAERLLVLLESCLEARKRHWVDIDYIDYGKMDPDHKGIYGATCECGMSIDLYDKSPYHKRVREVTCGNCNRKFRFYKGKAQMSY